MSTQFRKKGNLVHNHLVLRGVVYTKSSICGWVFFILVIQNIENLMLVGQSLNLHKVSWNCLSFDLYSAFESSQRSCSIYRFLEVFYMSVLYHYFPALSALLMIAWFLFRHKNSIHEGGYYFVLKRQRVRRWCKKAFEYALGSSTSERLAETRSPSTGICSNSWTCGCLCRYLLHSFFVMSEFLLLPSSFWGHGLE